MDLNILKNKFVKYRKKSLYEHQGTAILDIINSSRRIYVCEAPTGSGKSLIGACVLAAQKDGTGGIYIVHSKIHQKQIQKDFPEFMIMYGRNNYKCLKNQQKTAEDCTNDYRVCKFRNSCPYKVAKKALEFAAYKCVNYHYYLYESNYAGMLGNTNMLVIDEADNLEKALMDFISISFTKKMIDKYQLPPPKYKTSEARYGVESWKIWASEVKDILKYRVKTLQLRLKDKANFTELDYWDLKECNKLENLIKKIDMFLEYVDETWVFDHTDKQWIFKPLWMIPELADMFLWSHAKNILLMSATFDPTDVLCNKLGIDIEDVYRPDEPIPCMFPVQNRKITVKPVANLVYKNMDGEVPKLLDEIKNIINVHYNEKGIIHTVSYDLANRIKRIDSNRLLIHDTTNKNEVLQHFIRSTEPLVLISPIIDRGIDLCDALGRFAIICKAPYLSLADKVVKKRVYSSKLGKNWYVSDMLMTVIQMTGRIVRHQYDWGVCYILDQQIEDKIIKYGRMLPKWWLEALEFKEVSETV